MTVTKQNRSKGEEVAAAPRRIGVSLLRRLRLIATREILAQSEAFV